MPNESNQVDELVAVQQIRDVLRGYCRGLDRMDRPLADRTWHPGGTAHYGPFTGTGAEFLDFVFDYHQGFATHSHLIGNELVQVDLDAGTASSETYVAVWLRTPVVDGRVDDLFHRGRYVDQWSQRDGVWAIDHRTYVGDLVHQTSNVAPDETHGPASWGARDRTDPSYALFG